METKEILRKERGITLVALIITIIVLIILAAVSINAVLKTDFIGLATNGTINYAEAQVNEQKQMDDLNDKLDNVIARIEKVSSPETFTGYVLEIDGDSLNIRLLTENCAEFLANKMKNNIQNAITDEEIFVQLNGYNGTFEQAVEEAYNNGEIPEKYSTVKEFFIKGEGMTEVEAEKVIAEMRQAYFKDMNIDANGINVNNIKIIAPDGNNLQLWDYFSDAYKIPVEIRDYTFKIEYEGKSYPIKISIRPYEIVTETFVSFALDVQNKKYLTIESAKVNIEDNLISLGSEYLVERDEGTGNYINGYKVYNDYKDVILTRLERRSFFYWTSLTCSDSIIIEGYGSY